MDRKDRQWEGVDDPERFARIWNRVMPEGQEFAPIELVDSPRMASRPSGTERQSHPQADFLRRQIAAELTDWQTCRALSRRRNGVLGQMAARKLFRARRLSAAYFALTGIRFLPVEQARPHMGGLREQIGMEEQAEARYRRAGEECGDGILRTLFLELARGNAACAARLRQLAEGQRR